MSLPKVGENYKNERLGINAVQLFAARNGQIWRETDTGDVGIDGQLEFVTKEGFATGKIVSLQVKAGASYFKNPSATGWKFYPTEKHRLYWESFPLPVLIVLHDIENGTSYWTDARQAFRSPGGGRAYIEVPKVNILEDTNLIKIFENAGVQDQIFIDDISDIIKTLIATTSNETSFPLTYFDLFAHGLTNITRSIYYGTDVIINAVEYNLTTSKAPFGMGETEQDFAFGFVRFLLAQNLAQIDYSDCLIDWVDREMQPNFIAPLTSRGRALVAQIHTEEKRLVDEGKLPNAENFHVAQDGFFQMVPESYYPRFPRILSFQKVIECEMT